MYTLIIMKKNSTDSSPKTLHISFLTVFLAALFFFGLPVAGYFSFYQFVAPKLYQDDMEEITESKESLLKKYEIANAELSVLRIDHEKIKETLDKERTQRAGSEARATIAETAKTATGRKIADTESELITLQRKVSFYENLLKPKTEQERLQCFNTSASYKNNKVRYGISFLKNNPKDRQELAVKVELRVVQASGALQEQTDAAPVLATRKFSLSKDYRLSGSLTTTLDEDQLYLLDIRVYDAQDKSIAECWTSI